MNLCNIKITGHMNTSDQVGFGYIWRKGSGSRQMGGILRAFFFRAINIVVQTTLKVEVIK